MDSHALRNELKKLFISHCSIQISLYFLFTNDAEEHLHQSTDCSVSSSTLSNQLAKEMHQLTGW